MRPWLRFTVPLYKNSCHEKETPTQWGTDQDWTKLRDKDHSSITNCITLIASKVDFMLKQVTAQAHMQVDTTEHKQVVSDLATGLAWIISTPVETWYNNLDCTAKLAFGTWVRCLNKLPGELDYAVGPIITCSYVVRPYNHSQIRQESVADTVSITAGMAAR